jgi:hypothetical protein
MTPLPVVAIDDVEGLPCVTHLANGVRRDMIRLAPRVPDVIAVVAGSGRT